MNRFREDFIDNAYRRIEQIEAYAEQLENEGDTAQSGLIKEFARKIKIKKGGQNKNPEQEPIIKVAGGSYNSRGTTTFDEKGNPK